MYRKDPPNTHNYHVVPQLVSSGNCAIANFVKVESRATLPMRQRKLLQLLFAASCLLVSPLISAAQVDTDASNKTIILYDNLKTIQNSNQFLFGQEFFNSFRYSSGGAHGDEEYADCFAVTGAYPVVLGSDFHYYLEKD